VNQAGDEPLEQLALGQHDLGLVADALRNVAEALDGLAEPDQARQEGDPASEERAADREGGRKGEGSDRDGYRSLLPPRGPLRSAATTPIAPSAALR
jgi:hypothetical protein